MKTRRSRGSGTAAATRARKSANASTRPGRASKSRTAAPAELDGALDAPAPAWPSWSDRRVQALAAVSLVCVLVALAYVAFAARRTERLALAVLAAPTAAPETLALIRAQPHVLFLESQGDAFRRIALAPLGGIDGG